MTDTPQEIKELQLKIWLSKPPVERLRQMMLDNENLVRFWNKLRVTRIASSNKDISTPPLSFKPQNNNSEKYQ